MKPARSEISRRVIRAISSALIPGVNHTRAAHTRSGIRRNSCQELQSFPELARTTTSGLCGDEVVAEFQRPSPLCEHRLRKRTPALLPALCRAQAASNTHVRISILDVYSQSAGPALSPRHCGDGASHSAVRGVASRSTTPVGSADADPTGVKRRSRTRASRTACC